MLHILLTILKVIGILVLVILALLVLLILIVLFVPVRYRFHVRKESGPLEADGLVSWLLKMLRVTVRYRQKRGLAQIWVLWLRIKSIRIPDHGDQSDAKPAPESNTGGDTSTAGSAVPDHAGNAAVPEAASSGEDESAGSTGTASATRQEPVSKERPDHGPDKAPENREDAESTSALRKILELLPQKALNVLEKICNLLLRLIDLPFDLYDMADDTIDRVEKKIRAIRYKVEPFLSIEADHMIRKMIGYLLYLIRGWKPRKVEGYLEFGTGQPDLTGKLTGLIYLLLPEGSDRFELQPDFYEKRLLTDVVISGRIRFYRLAVVGFRILIDREFWALLRLIRHKPPKGKKRKRKSDSDNQTRRKNHG